MVFESCSSAEATVTKNIQNASVSLEKHQAELPLLNTKQGLTTDHPWIYISNLHFYVYLFIFVSLYAEICEANNGRVFLCRKFKVFFSESC